MLAADTSIRDYSTVAARLFAAVLRSVHQPDDMFKIKIPENALALATFLADNPEKITPKLLFKLGLQLISTPAEERFRNQWVCPVMQFFAGTTLSLENAFDSATNMTPRLARIKYFIRTVLYYEIEQWEAKNPGANSYRSVSASPIVCFPSLTT